MGDERVVDAGPIAHGGHIVAHSDGCTLFVRHVLPGERVRVIVTEVTSRIVRADAVEVLTASPDRVEEPCRYAASCGGCDFPHVSVSAQRDLKGTVLREAMERFGGIGTGRGDLDLDVHELPGHADGTRWRSRMRWARTPDGALALRAPRSHSLVEVANCVIAAEGVDVPAINAALDGASKDPAVRRAIASARELVAAQGSDGRVTLAVETRQGVRVVVGPTRTTQEAGGRTWRVAPAGFWQVHPALAEALQEEVVAQGDPKPAQAWWDLYAGAGLLAAALAERVTGSGRVDAVEVGSAAVREARRALHDLPQVILHPADVASWVSARADGPVPDGVVLDPPRAGAGSRVVSALARTGVPIIVYVACDPVALGRDVGLFAQHGYRLDRVRAFDAFPMTHHVETVARIVRDDQPGRGRDAPEDQVS